MTGFPSDQAKADRSDESVRAIESIVQELNDVFRQNTPFEEKARQALELGRDFLSVDNGHLTRIDEETDHWETLVSTDSPEGSFPPGLELDLGSTYCRRIVGPQSQLSLSDAPNQGWEDDPAFETHGIHCYLGTPIVLDGETYGTVCFVSVESRSKPFGNGEKLVAELISHMLGRELETEQHESQLMKQTNLSLVLNRVLRHNLRNELAIIRGYTQMMSESLTDSQYGQRALQSIDKLIRLSQKARELDEIVASDAERDQSDIRGIIGDVIASFRTEFPSASISIDTDEDVLVAVFPSFKRAMRELIENAVKHSGEHATIEISIESVPNAIEVRIADDGPGLGSQEIEVLRSGSETPLMHGSGLGLWLAHWIVSSHDGSVDATVTDAGTTLTVTVPRMPVGESEQPIRDLVRARDQYKAAFEEAGDAITIADDQARILDVNKEAARLYGLDRKQLMGRSMKDFLPDDFDFEAEWGEIQAAKMKRDEMQIASADGGVNPVEYTAKTDFVPGQHLIASRDVTDRKEHEREVSALKERYQALLEEIPAPVIVTDIESDEIIETNSAFDTLLGTSKDQLLGERLEVLFPEGDGDRYRAVFGPPYGDAETITRLPNGSPPTLITADGKAIPVEVRIGTVELAKREVMVGLFRTVSDLNAGKDSLQDRNEQLELFASVVSHDLRNPLNVASGRLELAMDDCDSKHLETIEDAHRRMERLIADLLVLARQGETVADPEPVALADLVNGCWRNVDTEAATLVADVDRTIRADASRVKQIFENLFRNAVEQGSGEVTVTAGGLGGGFYVEDDGPGIPKSEREVVFEAGYSTREGGSGFGLNIVKEIVEAHDWEIQVTEGSTGGARFEITGIEFAVE
ncbi:ATP-binding protein [Halodesulfurarchaeum sp. HSR-GB]|uniref:ATP-binding protein n=1 Tax=Halodesulfurarchaeum sp. HSR-GB TaxID=3074077 RepID=UPI00285E6C77|nr:ATP-binding protein [Halodesulfurarchaeum sp. HSR-GB]MDR5656391.1 ATP-binding protein [Halodesulfurarchaeum sp. HSR-GB]